MYVVYVFHGFALLSDNYVPPNYSVNVLKCEFIRNADINCILGFAEKTTISAASTTTTSIFNETSSALSTGRATSAVSLESTAITTENATGMTIDQWHTSAEHNGGIFNHIIANLFLQHNARDVHCCTADDLIFSSICTDLHSTVVPLM